MDKIPTLSIIVPIYNIEEYLEDCIMSIRKQKGSYFEVILVDDGSTDSCPEICDRFCTLDNRFKVIHTKNQGVSIARKTGIEASKGKYIVCIDSDDFIKEGCFKEIENTIDIFEPDIVFYKILCGNKNKYYPCKIEYKDGFYNKRRIEKEIFPSLIQSNKCTYFPPGLCGKVIKKSLLVENLLVNQKVNMGEDGACIIPCLFKADSMFILKEYYYYYRFNDKSATREKKPLNWEWSKIVYEHLNSHMNLESYDFEEQINRKIVHDLFQIIRSQYYAKKNIKEINNEILSHLNENIYKEALKKGKFSKMSIAYWLHMCLKIDFLFPFYIYSRII